jgi:hypothetical protein
MEIGIIYHESRIEEGSIYMYLLFSIGLHLYIACEIDIIFKGKKRVSFSKKISLICLLHLLCIAIWFVHAINAATLLIQIKTGGIIQFHKRYAEYCFSSYLSNL